ncbi:DUF1217 domain-containing protein [Halodurantibacterium flavum]|uniref:DUF1217 domain-containing protein n=1 Tax=Halodurantibacterium flavum TaxID=1382802 RepID=A0ABW4S8G2_9RHOB
MDRQTELFNRAPQIERDKAYFLEKIGSIDTAEELVGDRRLLRVALGAFGLEDDVNNTFFIRKVLEEGTLDPKSLANRLADKRYQEMAKAFNFDLSPPSTKISDFGARIVDAYKSRSFEVAVGEQDQNLRLALSLRRELAKLAEGSASENTKWFTLLGSAPMREVVQTAFGLPSSFGSIDLDIQLSTLKAKARSIFGDDSVSQFQDPDKVEQLIQRFLLRSEVNNLGTGMNSGSIALQLLQTSASRFSAR